MKPPTYIQAKRWLINRMKRMTTNLASRYRPEDMRFRPSDMGEWDRACLLQCEEEGWVFEVQVVDRSAGAGATLRRSRRNTATPEWVSVYALHDSAFDFHLLCTEHDDCLDRDAEEMAVVCQYGRDVAFYQRVESAVAS